jgi:large subunit ribosomal protein L6
MSRIGKMPVPVPAGVEVKIGDNNEISVKGPKGTLSGTMHKDMIITMEDTNVIVKRPSEQKMHKALHGLTRSLINNMVVGVNTGFEKTLTIEGVGYRAAKQGTKLVLTLGYSHPVEIEEPEGMTIEVPAPGKVIVKGIDKQAVGELAAVIRSKRKPEVYKGKGVRYENEVIRLKEGKAGGKAKK